MSNPRRSTLPPGVALKQALRAIGRHRIALLVIVGALWVLTSLLNVLVLPARYVPRVHVEVLKKEPLSLLVRAPGILEPKTSVVLKSDIDGPVVTKSYREGDVVTKGALLLEIGRDRIKGDYETKAYGLRNARADLKKAITELRLQRQLFKKQAVARSSVDDAERAVERATQGLELARTAFAAEEQRWEKNRVVAPFSGTIVKDSLDTEKNVSAQKEILTLADVSGYTVKARVDELEIKQVSVGQAAEIKLQAFDAPLQAVVQQIGSRADSNGVPEIPVIMAVTHIGSTRLLPNLSAEVRIFTGQTAPLISVPLTALGNQEGTPAVWVLDSFNRLRLRPVTLGRSNPFRVEIVKGVAEGDRLCARAGQFSIGARVRIDE